MSNDADRLEEVSGEGAVLVTGGTGLIGSEVARTLLERGRDVVVFDASAQLSSDLRGRVALEQGDIADLADLGRAITKHHVTRVVHLAAVLTISAATRPGPSITTNSVGTANVFEAASLFGLERVIWASSAAVYGRRAQYQGWLGRHIVTEDDPTAPYDVYGATKLLCENLAREYATRGIDLVGLRPVMTYGEDRFGGAVGVVNRAIHDAVVEGTGLITRPWRPSLSINPMHVTDAADLFARACLHPERFSRPVYNMGTGEYYSMQEMADIICAELPAGTSVSFDDTAPAEGRGVDVAPFDYADLDSSALRNELGWGANLDYRSGVATSINHYLKGRVAGM